ncbi:glycerol-3-phosphate 1-O-acyltransferase PlsY [Bacillaceae bacterium]
MFFVIAALAGYLLGSVSFSYLIAKKIANIDIREYGSGNAGATNTLRVLGKGPAAAVLLLDAGKGGAAVFLASAVTGGDEAAMVAAGVMAVVGHNWPLFFGFRGGKGIATTIGVMATLAFLPTLLAGLVAILVIAWKKYVSLGSLTLVLLLPLLLYTFQVPSAYVWGSICVAVLGVVRHYRNIVQLLRGKERKLGDSASRRVL